MTINFKELEIEKYYKDVDIEKSKSNKIIFKINEKRELFISRDYGKTWRETEINNNYKFTLCNKNIEREV